MEAGGRLQYTGANGFYINGTVYLDVHAGAKLTTDKSAILLTAAHELTHHIAENAPEQYRALKTYVSDILAQQGRSFSRAVREKLDNDREHVKNLDGAMEEVIADACETVLVDRKSAQEIAKQSPELAGTIRSWLEEFIGKIKAALNMDDRRHAESRAVENYMDEIGKLWGVGLKEAGKNERGSTASESGDKSVKHSDRGTYNQFREIFAKEGLDNLSVKLGSMFPLSVQFEKTVSSDNTPLVIDTVSSNQVKFGKGDKLFKTAKEAFQNAYGTKTTVHIKQLGMDVDLYQSIAQESISKIVGIYDVQQTLDVIPNLKSILSSSVLLGVERLSHTDNKKQGLFGLRMYNFYEYRKGNKKIPGCLVCTVVKDLSKSEGHIFKTIENVTLDRSLPGNKPGMSSPTSGDIYTVAQLYDVVKKISREEGGLNYTDSEKQKYLFPYTERNDGVKYSRRTPANADMTDDEIREQNKAFRRLQTQYASLEMELRNARREFSEKGVIAPPDRVSCNKFADKLISKYNSSADRKTVTELLYRAMDYFSGADRVNEEGFTNVCADVMELILKNSSETGYSQKSRWVGR